MVSRNHKTHVMHHMRRISFQHPTLMQGFAHQRDVALSQIPHAPMNQFCAAAACAFGIIVRLQQQGAITA